MREEDRVTFGNASVSTPDTQTENKTSIDEIKELGKASIKNKKVIFTALQ